MYKSQFILLVLSSILLFIFVFYFIYAYDFKEHFILLRNILCLYIFTLIPLLHIQEKYVSVIFFFVAGFILFNCSRIFLSLFDISAIASSDKFVFYTFKDETIIKTISSIGMSLCSVIIGYIITQKKIINELQGFSFFRRELLAKYLYGIIIICLPGLIYKSLYDLYIIKTYGYLILFMEFPTAPFVARASWGVFSLVFPMLFTIRPNKKEFNTYILFFFIISIFSVLKGGRGSVVSPIAFFLFYYHSFYSNKDISIKKILGIIVIIAYIANTMLIFRSDYTLDINISSILYGLFNSQGVTYVFIGNYFDYLNTFQNNSHWYILSPIVTTFNWFFNPLYRKGQSLELVQDTLNLDDQLMYSVSPDLYLSGVGYGSSYIAELFSLGGVIAIIIGSLILGCIIKWYENNYRSSKFLLYSSWYIIPHFIWMSRGSLIPNILLIIIGWLIYKITFSIVKNVHTPTNNALQKTRR